MAHTCKFCGHTWQHDCPCETSSWWDEENGEYMATYCGNQMCPMCSQCQGKEATEREVLFGQEIAAIKLGLG